MYKVTYIARKERIILYYLAFGTFLFLYFLFELLLMEVHNLANRWICISLNLQNQTSNKSQYYVKQVMYYNVKKISFSFYLVQMHIEVHTDAQYSIFYAHLVSSESIQRGVQPVEKNRKQRVNQIRTACLKLLYKEKRKVQDVYNKERK